MLLWHWWPFNWLQVGLEPDPRAGQVITMVIDWIESEIYVDGHELGCGVASFNTLSSSPLR